MLEWGGGWIESRRETRPSSDAAACHSRACTFLPLPRTVAAGCTADGDYYLDRTPGPATPFLSQLPPPGEHVVRSLPSVRALPTRRPGPEGNKPRVKQACMHLCVRGAAREASAHRGEIETELIACSLRSLNTA